MIPVKRQLSIPAVANARYADLSLKEQDKGDGWRVCPGEHGDLYFDGFWIEGGKTIIANPHLKYFGTDELAEEKAADIAEDILMTAFNSIGAECVEHS